MDVSRLAPARSPAEIYGVLVLMVRRRRRRVWSVELTFLGLAAAAVVAAVTSGDWPTYVLAAVLAILVAGNVRLVARVGGDLVIRGVFGSSRLPASRCSFECRVRGRGLWWVLVTDGRTTEDITAYLDSGRAARAASRLTDVLLDGSG
jgi:hypothetical protein